LFKFILWYHRTGIPYRADLVNSQTYAILSFMKQICALIGALTCAAPALADVKSGDRTIDCFCTDSSGDRIELGQSICLQVDGRIFTAQCQMSLNVPMWREMEDGCLTGSFAPNMLLIPAISNG
jgi:hypothetical protein